MALEKKYTLTAFLVIAILIVTDQGRAFVTKNFQPLLNDGLRNFQYTHRHTFMTDWPYPPMLAAFYLFSVFILRKYMADKKPWTMHAFRIIHNIFLSYGSFIVVLGVTMELIKAYKIGGFEALVCDENRVQQKHTNLYNWYYVFYLSKSYEYIDTWILCLRKKPLTFLHVFHHAITVYLSWIGLFDQNAIQWTIIVANASVHVFMYYYYLASSFNTDLWWKKYITTMQIIQFCIDLILGIPFYYSLYNGKNCSGSAPQLLIEHAALFSFLVLFINFYVQQYTAAAKARRAQQQQKVQQKAE